MWSESGLEVGITSKALMVQSLHVLPPGFQNNVSVASALVLYEAYHQRMVVGLYDRRSLDKETYLTLLFEACHPKIANYCRQKRLPYPAIDEYAEILEPVPGSCANSDEILLNGLKK